MGLLDGLMGMLGGKGGGQAALIGVVMEMLNKSGGMDGLIKKFEAAGLGDLIKGWISTGPNPEVKPEQLQAALGADMVQELAGKAGLDPQQLLGMLSGGLPQIIDQLTPDGAAPAMDMLQKTLGGLLGKK
jgi:uncharacterized protein YidB (DUF937 family)